jgi:hypothetical protein
MKYTEELSAGDCFILNNQYFILTNDFKKNGNRYCINLSTGYGNWIEPDKEVSCTDIFTLDKDNNIIAIKERKKDQNNDTSPIN